MKRWKLFLGPPGCGKTERLLTLMEERLEQGVSPTEIAFVSFTRAAVGEARERAIAKFGFTEDDLPLFRTLHSLAFRELGLRRTNVFGREALNHLSDLTGEELTGHQDLDAPTLGDRGDALLFLDQYARSAQVPLETAWRTHDADVDWFRLQRFVDAYDYLRQDMGTLDFTDMLEKFVREGGPIQAECAFIDEAQDLTPLQWRALRTALANVPEVWVAGDDDQAIYGWAGADVEGLLTLDADREVLSQSYRLPRAVYELATSITQNIERRLPKEYHPTNIDGAVEWLTRPDEVDLSSGKWLLLARTRRQLAGLVSVARDQGVVYLAAGKSSVDPVTTKLIIAWETLRRGDTITSVAVELLMETGAIPKFELEAELEYAAVHLGMQHPLPIWHDALVGIPVLEREYLLACRRRGESLTATPRVRIETIHGAKGLEAEHVLLLTDMNERVRRGMELDPDAEQRVLYVAVTRASKALYLVTPQGRYGYQL